VLIKSTYNTSRQSPMNCVVPDTGAHGCRLRASLTDHWMDDGIAARLCISDRYCHCVFRGHDNSTGSVTTRLPGPTDTRLLARAVFALHAAFVAIVRVRNDIGWILAKRRPDSARELSGWAALSFFAVGTTGEVRTAANRSATAGTRIREDGMAVGARFASLERRQTRAVGASHGGARHSCQCPACNPGTTFVLWGKHR
jgi:hypothetical protein